MLLLLHHLTGNARLGWPTRSGPRPPPLPPDLVGATTGPRWNPGGARVRPAACKLCWCFVPAALAPPPDDSPPIGAGRGLPAHRLPGAASRSGLTISAKPRARRPVATAMRSSRCPVARRRPWCCPNSHRTCAGNDLGAYPRTGASPVLTFPRGSPPRCGFVCGYGNLLWTWLERARRFGGVGCSRAACCASGASPISLAEQCDRSDVPWRTPRAPYAGAGEVKLATHCRADTARAAARACWCRW